MEMNDHVKTRSTSGDLWGAYCIIQTINNITGHRSFLTPIEQTTGLRNVI
jgi:hypothetical protein